MTAFSDAFAVVVGVEGGFQNDPRDTGNWTGGKCGAGVCKGTKYGISAAAYPNEDIAGLTLERAQALAKARYWDPLKLDQVDPRIAFQVFDTAYNGGYAAKWLQQAAGLTGSAVDGSIGPATLAAIASQDPDKVIMRFDACRLEYLTDCATWPTYSRGWTKRVAANLRRAAA
jgi:lysozyme family protein